VQTLRCLFLVALGWCSIAQSREALQLPPVVTHTLEEYRIPSSSLSVYIEDARTQEVVLSYNAEVPRSPASTIKALTTFIALDELGPAYTWTTRAYARGPIKHGVLTGDLYIVGGGDPYMTAERWWTFVQQLRQAGLRAIDGDVVLDRSYFGTVGDDRAAFDSQPFKSYNVLPDALMVNFQTSRFTVSGDAEGGRANIALDPMPANLQIGNQVRLTDTGCRRANQGLKFDTPDGPTGNTVVVRGTIPSGCGRFAVAQAIMTAPEFAYGTFRTFWEQTGGAINGKLRLGALPDDAKLLYAHESLTLGEIIRLVNKYSNNVMARTLMLTLGAEKFEPPATVEKGRRAIDAWLIEHRIEIPGFVIDNGSGLSRDERVTAKGLGEVLRVAYHSQFMPEFAASLPLSATDGTLRRRFQAQGMQGRIRMKTGHMDDVSSLAGFVNAASGNSYVVVILVNHPGAQFGVGDDIQAATLRWVFGQ
jgi:D-alanyl-D-alanine carboxypeptidase/D-alanyl-D-alanine-endopeptidase (penicillin-binding protein 4)